MGVFTPQQLVEKRSYVIVGAFIIGMILSPPDVISQTLLAVPMWLLFEVGVLVSRVILRRKEAREQRATTAQTPVAASAPATAAAVATDANFRPLTPDEMDAELDSIAQEQKREREGGGDNKSS